MEAFEPQRSGDWTLIQSEDTSYWVHVTDPFDNGAEELAKPDTQMTGEEN